MSDLTGDTSRKKRGRNKWALVNPHGEIEGSDDGTTSGSSSDFVHLEDEDVVSYHHKETVASPSGSGLQQNDAEGGFDASDAIASMGIDDLVTATCTVAPPGEPDSLAVFSAHRRSLTTWDSCWYWDDDCIPQADSVESDESQLLDVPSSSSEELLTHVIESGMSGDQEETEVKKVEDDIEDVHPISREVGDAGINQSLACLRQAPGGACKQVSDTDSDHSDFVRLDPEMVEEVNLCNPVAAVSPSGLSGRQDVMQSSASSTGSSISVNFRFVHPVAGRPGRYSDGAEGDNDDDDDESIPLDVDDRCESDISGIADDDDDLSSVSYNIADLPLTVGNVVRSYRHRPNTKMNTFLTVVALVTMFAAIGIGIGHYFGSVKESRLRDDQVVHMKSLQDDYLRCLRQQNSLTSQLAASTPSEKKISTVTSLWKTKYEELIFEKADLEMKMMTMNEEMKTVGDQIKTCQSETVKLKDDLDKLDMEFVTEGNKLRATINEKMVELGHQYDRVLWDDIKIKTCQEESDMLKKNLSLWHDELIQCKHVEGVELRQSITAMKSERNNHKRRAEELERQLKELSSAEPTSMKEITSLKGQLDAEKYAHARTLEEITTLKNRLNQLQTEHLDLQEKSMKLRYVEHPANCDHPPEVAAIALKNTVNLLANENDDLKTAIGKMRYQPYLNTPDGSGCADKQARYGTVMENTAQPSDSGTGMRASQDETEVADVGSVEGPPQVEELVTTEPEEEIPMVQRRSKPQERLAEIEEWLQRHHGCTDLLKSYVKEKAHDKEHGGSDQFSPTFFTCASYLLVLGRTDVSQWIKDTADNIIGDDESLLQQNWAFLKMMVTDSAFTNSLRRKWEEIDGVAASTETVDKVSSMVEKIRGLLQQKWDEFVYHARPGKPKDKDGKTGANSSAKFQAYLNRTKETVHKLTQKIKSTWSRVKNLSSEFLTKHEPMKKIEQFGKKMQGSLKSLTKTIKTQLQEIKQKIRRGKKMLFKHGSLKHKGRKQKGHRCKKNTHCKEDHHRFASTRRRDFDTTKRDRTHSQASERRHFKNRPHHKQRQSSEYEESYEDFWRLAPFTPDEIVPEDFFEGNRREQRKQKQRFRKMHGRIQQFNEELLYSTDDDDIEEMWEDFRKLKDDFDDVKEQPDRLRMWLTCQSRWWKSRFHRKHRDENKIVNGCQRQLMPWQMSVLCCHRLWCHGDRDRKCQHKFKRGPFCRAHAVMVTMGIKWAEDDDKRGRKRADRYSRDRMVQKPVELSTEVVTDDVKQELLPGAAVDATANDTLLEMVEMSGSGESSGEKSIWYFRRMKRHIGANGHEDNVEWYWDQAGDRESHRQDSSWYLRSMRSRRNAPPGDSGRLRNSDPKWLFERASEREFQREMSWYLKRAESREDHHFDILQGNVKDKGGN